MSLSDVTPDQILNAMQRVPTARWGEILRAIEDLQDAPTSKCDSPIKTGADLRESSLIGIWANRGDIGSGHEFARELRRQAEQRK